jgi:hypothetical protein
MEIKFFYSPSRNAYNRFRWWLIALQSKNPFVIYSAQSMKFIWLRLRAKRVKQRLAFPIYASIHGKTKRLRSSTMVDPLARAPLPIPGGRA